MIEINGECYYLDLEVLDKLLITDESLNAGKQYETETVSIKENNKLVREKVKTKEFNKGREIDVTRYDMVRTCLEIVLYAESDGDGDSTLGLQRMLSGMSLSYQIAFNTLIKYNILKYKTI